MKFVGVFTISFCAVLATTSPGRVERARFDRIATLHWHLPYSAADSPWSPTENLLAVDSAGRLAVFDPLRPHVPPRTLLATPSPTHITVSWSPDGRWIACETKTYSMSGGRPPVSISDTLWAIPVTGGRPTVVKGAEVWPFLWGSDGALYSWEGSLASKFVPPGPQLPDKPSRTMRIAGLAQIRPQGIARVTPGDPPEVAPLQLGQALLRGSFHDGRRFLMTRLGGEPRSVVVDKAGEVLANLDGPAREDSSGTLLRVFTPTSVTADAKYVVGFYEVDKEDDVVKATVFLTDTLGHTRIPLEGACYSTRPECSTHGPWIALEALRGGVVEIGSLVRTGASGEARDGHR